MKTIAISITLAMGYIAVQAMIYAMQYLDKITGYLPY